MARRRRSLLRIGAVVVSCLLAVTSPASAAEDYVEAGTSGTGVDIHWVRQEDGSGRGRASDGCEWRAVPVANIGEFTEAPRPAGAPRENLDEELYVVWCEGRPASYAWLGPRDFRPRVEPLVEELVDRVSVLRSGVQVRPDSRGITGIPSMFWVDGPGASPAAESVSAFGLTVTVSFALLGVEWDFGDGTPTVSGGLGEAYPERSSIQHTYRDASPNDVPYRVTATLTFQPSYSVSDGSTTTAGEALAPIRVPVTRDYLVRQVQAIRKR